MAHDLQTAAASSFSAWSAPELADAARPRSADEQFDALCADLTASGGLARGEDLALLFERGSSGAAAGLPELMASDRIFGFQRSQTFWVPMFQFETGTLAIKPSALKARAELHGLDGWDVASWFAATNWWLRGRRPVDLLDSALHEVLEAARIDRFIRAG
jgi:hypothetical protein